VQAHVFLQYVQAHVFLQSDKHYKLGAPLGGLSLGYCWRPAEGGRRLGWWEGSAAEHPAHIQHDECVCERKCVCVCACACMCVRVCECLWQGTWYGCF